MAVTSQLSEDRRTLTIRVSGRFDSDLHMAFREAFQSQPRDRHFVVELGGVEQLDSSALGLLLLLREHAGGDQARVKLRGASPPIRELLELSRFERLFDMSEQ